MISRPINRMPTSVPVDKMLTHAILAPVATHWRKATCAEVDCAHWRQGWGLRTAGLDAASVDAAKRSGRRFVVEHDENGAEVLMFGSDQPCFRASEHRVRADRPELFVMRRGDHRGNPDPRGTKPLLFSGADAWKDSLGTTLDNLRRD